MLIDMKLSEFLDELASDSPAPGGGSASALSGSLSAGLICMVCRLSIGEKQSADYNDKIQSCLSEIEMARTSLSDLIDKDTEAFNGVMKSFKLPRNNDAEKAVRSQRIQEAFKDAVATPMQILNNCMRLLETAFLISEKFNENTASDLGVAVQMAYAGLHGAAMNVSINLPSIKDQSFVEQTQSIVDSALKTAATIKTKTDKIISKKINS